MISQTRRSFLQFAGSSLGAAVVARASLAAPNIVHAELTPQAFGATGGDPIADTRGWNHAAAEAARTGRPVMAHGTYVLRVPASGGWNWPRWPASSVHIAVPMRSGVHIQGRNAQILVGKPEAAPRPDERHFLFGTGLNVRAGSLHDISLEGLIFDFRDEFGPLHTYTYAVGITGVDNFHRKDITLRSSGTRAGRGLLSENVRGRVDTNITHQNIVQGIYTRYEYGTTMRRIAFDSFVEAIDFDGPCWDVILQDLEFRNGVREAQCIDTGGGSNWLVRDVRAEHVGNIMDFYVKPDAWPDYASWLTGRRAPVPVPPTNMTLRNVHGTNVGKPSGKEAAVLRIGAARTRHWTKQFPPTVEGPRRIRVENVTLTHTSPLIVNDCLDLTMRGIELTDTHTPAAGAALLVQESPDPYPTRITGEIADVDIREADGIGVSVTAGPELTLAHIRVSSSHRADPASRDPPIAIQPRIGGGLPRTVDVKAL